MAKNNPYSTLSILLADDHEVVRKGLRPILEAHQGWHICGEACTGLEAIEKAQKLQPHVVVLDITMSELNGLAAARQIRSISPKTEILFLTIHDSAQMVREALDAGGRGYVLKSDAGRELVAAVEALRLHKTFFSEKISHIAEATRRGKNKPSSDPLTPRERQIVQLIGEGKSTKEIAVALNVAVKTAETHRTHIMRKLDFHSMSEIVRYAIRNKIVEA